MLSKLSPQPAADGSGEYLAAHALHGAVAGALHRLRDGDRDVLLLVAWAELTYEEAAEALDVPFLVVFDPGTHLPAAWLATEKDPESALSMEMVIERPMVAAAGVRPDGSKGSASR